MVLLFLEQRLVSDTPSPQTLQDVDHSVQHDDMDHSLEHDHGFSSSLSPEKQMEKEQTTNEEDKEEQMQRLIFFLEFVFLHTFICWL